ncbi:MAG: photosystem II reaction center protein Psb28, partial [Okeania sp. SIO3H1]|nr:photosystem II reaction center protein Psb28 [Okeania sp. SIO3H1]
MTVSVEFIEGLNEKITEVSLRKRRNSDTKIVVLMFDRLQATESFRSFTNKINKLWLKDEEGNIEVAP